MNLKPCRGTLKAATSQFAHIEMLASIFLNSSFVIRVISILSHPCSLMVNHYLFGVFLPYLTVIFRFASI